MMWSRTQTLYMVFPAPNLVHAERITETASVGAVIRRRDSREKRTVVGFEGETLSA
jgi:hypothetical protein